MPKATNPVAPSEREFQDAKFRVGQGVIAFSDGVTARFYHEDAYLVDMLVQDAANKIFYSGVPVAEMPARKAELWFDVIASLVNVPCVIMTRDRGEWLPVATWTRGVCG
jgi:hypothetical protein